MAHHLVNCHRSPGKAATEQVVYPEARLPPGEQGALRARQAAAWQTAQPAGRESYRPHQPDHRATLTQAMGACEPLKGTSASTALQKPGLSSGKPTAGGLDRALAPRPGGWSFWPGLRGGEAARAVITEVPLEPVAPEWPVVLEHKGRQPLPPPFSKGSPSRTDQ